MTIHALTRTQRRTSTPAPARRARRLASALGSVLALTAGVLGAGALTAAVPAGAAVPARAGAARAGRPRGRGPAQPRDCGGHALRLRAGPAGLRALLRAVPAPDGGQPGARGGAQRPRLQAIRPDPEADRVGIPAPDRP